MNLIELFSDHTFRTVLMGTMSIGAISGAIGCFAYLRRQSLIGDVVSHSSLFGIMLFFLGSYWITGQGSKSLFVLIPGAIVAGVTALLMTRLIVGRTNVREDSGLGVMLAIFFGSGIMLLRLTQRTDPPIPGQRGLEDYLFGMAASMTQSDLYMIAIVGLISIAALILYWKELKLFTFDPLLAQSLGFRIKVLEVLLIAILVCGIVIGIQAIGVVLMVAMLITPAAAARQWTQTLGKMVSLAACIGALCGAIGTIASAQISNVPTGPIIVLAAVSIFVFSLAFAGERGFMVRRSREVKEFAKRAERKQQELTDSGSSQNPGATQ